MVRGDLALLDSYQPAPTRAPLACPVTAFAGVDDVWAPPHAMRPWLRDTAGALRTRRYPGHHFFFLGDAFAGFCRDVVDEIRAAAAGGSDPRDRLHRGCATYVAYAQRHPQRYAMMTRAAALTPAAAEALGVVTRGLANCGTHAELPRIAAALSTALHGVAMLNRTDAPSMWLADISPTDVITTLVDSAVDQLDRAEENT